MSRGKEVGRVGWLQNTAGRTESPECSVRRWGRDGEGEAKAHSPGKESRPWLKDRKLLNYFWQGELYGIICI